eukprot:13679402-Alexandrium_andersonii.AAC.1
MPGRWSPRAQQAKGPSPQLRIGDKSETPTPQVHAQEAPRFARCLPRLAVQGGVSLFRRWAPRSL